MQFPFTPQCPDLPTHAHFFWWNENQCHCPETIYSKVPYSIYDVYWKCTMFCPEIYFWSLDWCKQLSIWERFNYQLQMSREAGSRTPATWLFLSVSRYLPPPKQTCTLDTSHLSSENRCSRHLEIKRRWLATKYAGVPRPHALHIFSLFSGFWERSVWLSFLKCWGNWNILALCSI